MEAIATGLAVEAAKAITKVVAGSAFEEMKLVWGFKDQLAKLKQKFHYIEALLNDLEQGKYAEKSQLVSVWLHDVKEVAYSAEYLLDDYQYEMLRRKIELKTNRPSFKKKCSNYLKPSTCPIVFRIRMTHRVNQILTKFDELEKLANSIGLKPVQLVRDYAISASTSADHIDPLSEARKSAAARGSEFIGRVNEKEELLQRLLHPSTNQEDGPSIIAIVGIGGLGKTTLARQLYEHEKVDGQVALKKLWICVSEDFRVERILKEMVESLKLNKCDLTNTDAIIKTLQEELKGNKFFLVLDDVWNDNNQLWGSLKTELQRIGGLAGSVVLITTRGHQVANKACASYVLKLKGLSEEDGWDLLKWQVFYDKAFPYDPSLDDVGRRIVVEKCKGIPLAIKSIGSLLQSKQHKFDWLSIENSELWNIEADDRNYLMPSLLLSYNHINPVNVRQCFAYCAIFPKDSEMEKRELITLWLSQGLIHDEASGEKCFDILVNFSFLQKENDDYRAKYKMHDLVHDLATYVLKKELLVWKAKDEIDVVDYEVRHLVFNLQDDEIALETLVKEQMRKLRTISFWQGMSIKWNSLICARNMHTLAMVNVGLTEVPSIIGQLVHLRYLDLSENNIKALPELVCKLYQLETLRLLYCTELEELPEKLHKLRNLRHIETSQKVYASRGLRKLTCLQTLPYCLGLRDGKGWTIDELGPLDQVKGDVRINNLEFVKSKEEANGAMLRRKDKILKLELFWDGSSEGHNNDEVVLDGLEPHPNIQRLEVDGFGGVKFPKWIMTIGQGTQLCYLTEVLLIRCRRCQQLPSLGQLSKLRILRLFGFDEVESIGEEFYEDNNNIGDIKVLFPALREFYLRNFKSLTTWMPPSSTVATRSCFPELETLGIIDCPELERVPSLRLKSIKHLKLENVGLNSLKVVGINEMVSQSEELLDCINLETLEIIDCEKMKWIHIEEAAQLTRVKLRNCSMCKKLPSLGQLPKLTILELEGFDEVECIGDEFYGDSKNIISDRKVLFPELRELHIIGFKRLTTWMAPCLGVGTSVLPKLETLQIDECRVLETVPAIKFETLKDLQLGYVGGSQALDIIKRSPEELSNCIDDCSSIQGSLTRLDLGDAGGMMGYLPRWIPVIPQLHGLKELDIRGWGKEWDMSLTSTLPSLTILRLTRFPNMKALEPERQHLLPPSLKQLTIIGFEEMEALPDWIGGLSSLQKLELWSCYKLKYLPSERAISRLTQLRALYIHWCPELEERCDKHKNGPESQWPKISHLPKIVISWKNVQDP